MIELFNQCAHQGQTSRVSSAQYQGIASGFRNKRGFKRCIGLALRSCASTAGLNQARDDGRQVCSKRVLQANDFYAGGVGYVKRRDDCADTLKIVSIVRDDQRVVAGVDVNGVVRGDQWPQDGHQIVGGFMVQTKNLSHDLTTCGGHFASRHRTALQLGICLWHHQVQACRLNQSKTLRAQLR